MDRAADTLNNLGNLAVGRKDLAGARRLYEEALDTKHRAGTSDVPLLINLGWLALEVGDLADAEEKTEAARSEAAAPGVDHEAWSDLGLGVVAWLQADLATAAKRFDHGVGLWEELETRPTLVYGYAGRALVHRDRGEVPAAADKAGAAVGCAIGLGGGERYAFAFGIVVSVLAAANRWAEAARLGAGLLALVEAHGWPMWSWWRGHLDACLEEARAGLGAEAFAAAEGEGATMTIGDALRYARSNAEQLAGSAPSRA